jgi:hypothetical protein
LEIGKEASSGRHFHAVRFFRDSASLCTMVGDFISEGIANGQPAIVIARPHHREDIARHLRASAIDTSKLEQNGDLYMIDADATLAEFIRNGRPDSGRFNRTMRPLLEKAARGRPHCTVRAYGEMVDVLWKDGATAAAIRLEMLWNELASRHSLSLLCGYAMGNFYKEAAVEDICSHHTHVISETGAPVVLT